MSEHPFTPDWCIAPACTLQELMEERGLLHHGTGVSARFWLALEHNYRAGLAAGLTDVSHDAS